LRPPKKVDIAPNAVHALLANDVLVDGAKDRLINEESLRVAANNLLMQTNAFLQVNSEEVAMFVLDIPEVPPQYAPVIIADASQASQRTSKLDQTWNVCQLLESRQAEELGAANILEPALAVKIYMQGRFSDADIAKSKVSVVENPKHGVLESDDQKAYLYTPDSADYIGQDATTFLVEISGFSIKLIYSLHVDQGPLDDEQKEAVCPAWITKMPVTSNVSHLSNGALAQTIGATITLDDNAAGNGWFIDYTPWLNEEWLPTSNPYEWKAKEGSEAAGKMDLWTSQASLDT